jgi:hypothetical protein
MIADLLRAFVEAVIVREMRPGLPPGARAERVFIARSGFPVLEWSAR